MAEIERDFMERTRSPAEWSGDLIGGFAGSLAFIVLQVVFIGAWIVVNLGFIPGISPFDKFPFVFLQLVLSTESIFLLTFILLREARLRRQEQLRDELHLQVNLLADRKASEILQILLKVSERLGLEELADDEERKQLSQATHLETLQHEVEKNLPDQ